MVDNKAQRQLRKDKKLASREGLPKYYNLDVESTSKAGKVYYNLQVNTLVKPKHQGFNIMESHPRGLYMNFVFSKLGLQ